MVQHKVLFVCIHNSARSQMAEAFLKKLGGEYFEAESAGLEPGKLNPSVVEVMQEIGIDISHNKPQDVFDLFKRGNFYNAVVSVCDESRERCPIFPGMCRRITWSFEDPAALKGTKEEVLQNTRIIRDEIKSKVEELLKESEDPEFWFKS